MSKDDDPVVLELSPLPREQLGPFLLLGLDKDADQSEIEANWAQRVLWARKNQIRVPLGDINWAREVINDPERRVRADVTSLNLDTAERVVSQLAERFGATAQTGPNWCPIDVEKPLEPVSTGADLPDPEQLRAAITLPELPLQFPAVRALLEDLAKQRLDPWDLNLPGLMNRVVDP